MAKNIGEAEGRYAQLESKRNIALGRAKECAKYTLPHLFLNEEESEVSKVQLPWNDIGTQGVNNLGSKLLLTLFPPNTSFFRILVDDVVFEEENRPEAKTETEEALSKYERRVMADVEAKGDRVVAFETLMHLLVGGNVLLHVEPDDGLKMFSLNNYVCRRDRKGNVLEIVVKESVSPKTLKDELAKRIPGHMAQENSDEKNVDIFTHIKRTSEHWEIYQEAQGKKIPGSRGTEPLDTPSWLPIRMIRASGKDYGFPYVEMYLGDLKTLDGLTQALTEGSAAAARLLILVAPNGTTSLKTIANAPNLAVVEGNREDISTLQMEKFHDFQVAQAQANKIEERLQAAFLLHASYQRQAERVTAEEIRRMAQDLEDALGGIYSMLSLEYQMPYIKARIAVLEKKGTLPSLPKDITRPTIITGLEALGRGHERSRLVAYVQTLQGLLGEEQAAAILDGNELARRLGAHDGVDLKGLIITKEQQEQQQEAHAEDQMNQDMMNNLGPEAIKQMGKQIPQA